MKILCVGCSFTEGHGKLNWRDTYPYMIKERFPEHEIFNLGLRGANNIFINLVLQDALIEIKPDFVIRQVTSWNRSMAYKEKLVLRKYEVEPNYHLLERSWYEQNVAFWTAGGPAHPLQNQIYSEKEKITLHQNYYDNHTYQFMREYEESALAKSEKLLTDVPHMMLFWRDLNYQLPNSDWWGKYPCVERDIGFELCVDEGKHFDRTGNTILIDQLLEPEIKKYV